MGVPGGALMGDLNRLPPGFRFHPTDEELVCDYLRKKSSKLSKSKSKYVYLDIITDIDLYKHEPSELPGRSCFQGGGQQWFFFTQGDLKKYPTGSRLNRATEGGYWKTTGRDRPVLSKGVTVGMKKTLVFYSGRAPHGQRTNWIMHEYRLVSDGAGKSPSSEKDSFVLCRVFLKSVPETKTKEQHKDSYQGENSTSACYALATEEEKHEDVITLPAKEVEIKDRDPPFGPFTSSEENCIPIDDDLHKFLLECLNESDKETGDNLLQISAGAIQSHLYNDPVADPKYIGSLNDEASFLRYDHTVDQKLDAENNMADFLLGDTSEQWNFERLLSPVILAGDFIELNDLTPPLAGFYCLD